MSAARPSSAAGAEGKAAALARGRRTRGPAGRPSAQPIPPEEPAETGPTTGGGPEVQPERPEGRAPAGQGRRGHLKKLSLELTTAEHDRLKLWLVTAFGGSAKATPVLRALLAEAYDDPGLTERVRARLEQSRD